METRGIRNNNPLNIRHGKSKWVGMCKFQTDTNFVQFVSKLYGYRAAFVLLRKYIKRGLNTIGKIINGWAPPSDGNNTKSYINYVGSKTGIDVNLVLKFEDIDKLVEIVRCMARMESGIDEDKTVIREAYDLATKKQDK